MAWSRKTVLDALTNRLSDGYGITTCSRSFRAIDEVSSAEQPAVFVSYLSESITDQPNEPTINTIQVALTVYCLPADLCAVIDALVNSLSLQSTETGYQGTTLGGLVETVNITNIEVDEGISIEQQAGALVALEIVIAN